MIHELIQKEFGIIKLVLALLALFLLVATFGNLKEQRFIGSGLPASNTITVTGEGKIDRAPDTAKVTFSIRNESKDLKTAQDAVTTKMKEVTNALKVLGIEERHIKTESYNSYPQYNYEQTVCYGVGCPRPGTPVIRGYEVAHTVTVSIKVLEKVNDVLAVLGTAGVTDMSGPQFGFEDDNAIAREARDLAIADAKAEAKELAKALGVKLVRIVSFSEGGSYPMPLYARMEASGAAQDMKVDAPTLPVGDQTIQSNVTIVYEIK